MNKLIIGFLLYVPIFGLGIMAPANAMTVEQISQHQQQTQRQQLQQIESDARAG